jgi:hypothetical protein
MEGSSVMEQSVNHQWAIYYRQQGLSIFPVKEKMPLVKWKEFQGRLANEEEIGSWWSQWPEADIGCVTGRITNRLVLDIDGDEGRASISGKALPVCPSVRTRRGHQYHFRYPAGLSKSTLAGILPGVDVRGEGGYVKMPPSKCTDGTLYSFLPGLAIHETALADAPAWLIELLSKGQSQTVEQNKELKPQGGENWLEEILEGISDGGRHGALVRLAGYYFSRMAPDLAIHHLREWNKKNKPPIETSEFEFQVRDLKTRYKRNGDVTAYAERVVEQAKPIQVMTAKDILAYEGNASWIIEGMIPEKGITLLGGEPGAGKTWMSLDLAIEVARGGMWLNKFPVKQCSVLYVDEEKPVEFFKKRLPRLLTEKGLTLENLPLNFSIDKGIRFDMIQSRMTFEALVDKVRPGLIILDALVDFHSKEEASSTAIMEIFNVIKEIRRKFNCTWVVIDHERKPTVLGKDGKPVIHADSVGNDLRGSNAKRGAVDTQFSIKKIDGMHRVYNSKASWGKDMPPFAVEILDPEPNKTRVEFKDYL